jgi:lipopolysaccharide transport system ATP-binding protein
MSETSSQPALAATDLGKRYFIGAPEPEAPSGRWRLPAWLRFGGGGARREFWALRDVSFELERGTILGIIGANGAGKSTLLKVLARVSPPTTGQVRGVGRVVSLLELGAGFDPDLNAHDNVIMNAAMHGIPRAEALARLPGILEFAELSDFSGAPLRHYSSGMYLRLAFSVAINMEPRILLADEILAVGDSAFQERCLQKVEEAGRNGLVVLFVSHDMEAIARVCNRVMWLHKGQVQRIGDPEDVIADYQDATWADDDASQSERGRGSSRFAVLRGAKLLSAEGKEIGAAPTDEDVFVSIAFEAFKAVSVKGAIDVHVKRQLLFRAVDEDFRQVRPGPCELRVRIPANLLTDISYTVTASMTTLREGQERQYRLVMYNALTFMAFRSERATTSVKGRAPRTGLLSPRLDWSVEEHSAVGV